MKTTFSGHTHLSHLSSRHQVLSFQNLLCLDLFGCGRGIPNTVVSSTGGYQTNDCQTQCAKILLYQVTATNPENAKSAKEDSETVFCSYFLKTYLYYTPGNRDKKKLYLVIFPFFDGFCFRNGAREIFRQVGRLTKHKRSAIKTKPAENPRPLLPNPGVSPQTRWHANRVPACPGACQQNCGGPLVPASLLARGFPSFFAICRRSLNQIP